MLKTGIEIKKTDASRLKNTDLENPVFGTIFSDHMFSMEYKSGRWGSAQIVPFGNMEISPAMCSLHYGQAIFEGIKAFSAKDGSTLIFRPQKYHERMNRSCKRLCIPEVGYDAFIDGLSELVKLDRGWVPPKHGCSLYIRPFIFAADNFIGLKVSDSYRFLIITCPVGFYYKEGINPISLVTSGDFVRAVKGGLGEAKTPANYAASLLPTDEAKKKGFTQVLWLDGVERKFVEEVGTMNIFFVIGDELVTPSLDGSVLAGVTRDSVIHLARDWGIKVKERKISIDEVFAESKSGRLKEVFGTGTAVVISPVGEIQHQGHQIIINNGKTGELSRKFYERITAIQYGTEPDKFGWCHKV